MACLHLISSEQALAECLQLATEEDSLLLLGKAAAAAGKNTGRRLLVLEDDLPAGLTPSAKVTVIGYAEFVNLAVRHQPIVTWR